MSDLRSLMHEAAGLAEHTTAAVADADLARARRTFRRRRARRVGAGSVLVAAAAVGAFTIVAPTMSPSDSTDQPTTAAHRQSGSSIALVSYTGKQPTGYVLDKVPAGWEIRDDNPGMLTLVPRGTARVHTPAGTTSLANTIAVSTESDTGVPTGVKLDPVQVGGRPGVIAHMKGPGDTRTLFLKQPSGAYLVIQVWDGLGWNNDQIATFATSVHVTKDAKPSVG